MAQDPPTQGCLTHYETSGTFYEVGYNTAAKFRDRTRLFFNRCSYVSDSVVPLYDSRQGRQFYEECLRVCQDCFPQYVREVRGISEGAGLPFEHVFMVNVFEYDLDAFQLTKPSPPSPPPPEGLGCTTLFMNTGGTKLLLHNEDGYPEVKECGYLLTATVQEGEEREHFTSFCYPGVLPGQAITANKHGVAFTSNSLCPAHAQRESPGVTFLLRSLVRARDVQDAVRLARNAPYGCAYGFSVNLCTREGHMTSLEVGPGKPEAQVHVHDVTGHNDPQAESPYYYHCNAYKHLKVPEATGRIHNTLRRAQRTAELPPPRSLQDGLNVLADTKDTRSPIFRTPRPSDGGETVCTGVFDVTASELLFFDSRQGLLTNSPAVKLPIF